MKTEMTIEHQFKLGDKVSFMFRNKQRNGVVRTIYPNVHIDHTEVFSDPEYLIECDTPLRKYLGSNWKTVPEKDLFN